MMNSLQQESGNYLASSKLKMACMRMLAAFTMVAQLGIIGVPRARAGSNLGLAPNLSFDNDSSPNFPIQGHNLSDGLERKGEAALIFFGTSNCWNTAREAERVVKLYPQYRNRLHFIVVDLRNVSPAQQPLVARYYHGYIPTVTAISSQGKVIYNRAGETATNRGDISNLQRLLDSLH
jgi:hypothetical protein